MKKNNIYIFIYITISILSSCTLNYSFTGASISPDTKTISIQYFNNNATLAPPTTSQKFTEALRDIFNTQTSLSFVPKGGDLNFSGAITSFTTSPLAIQANQISATNRLTITVTVKFENKNDEKQNFETGFSRFADYSSSKTLTEVQDDLIKEINSQLVQDIFNRSVTNW